MSHYEVVYIRMVATSLCLLGLLASQVAALGGQAVQFPSHGVMLPGSQLHMDTAFDLIDYNGDGLLDLVMPNGSMMAYFVHRNEGSAAEPAFHFASREPVNFTEVRPFGAASYYYDVIEHGQAMAFGDLTGNGLFDVVTYDGRLKLIVNQGVPYTPDHWEFFNNDARFPGSAAMLAANARYATSPQSMYWGKGIFGRQVLTMTLADFNGNGLLDLIVCRMRDQAPGVVGLGLPEHWTPFGRGTTTLGPPRTPQPTGPTYEGALDFTPPRETWVYLNQGTATEPWFDQGFEITAGGASIHAPNPVLADIDGDGVPDLLATEVAYDSNAIRIDWPTQPHVVWYRRPSLDHPQMVQAAQPLLDASGAAIPAGSIRWYRNQASPGQPASFAPPVTLRGTDFARMSASVQPVIADWFAPGSRDLLLHGVLDDHCKWGLRRTALYRNAAAQPGELDYQFVGFLDYNGDPAMVPQTRAFESSPIEVYWSVISVMPRDDDGQQRMVMSVNGRLYFFSDLDSDALSFRNRTLLEQPSERNEMSGWQDIALDASPVRYIRIEPSLNYGLLRDSHLNIVRFEALEGQTQRATPQSATVTISESGSGDPAAMLQPGEDSGAAMPAKMTSVRGNGHILVTLDQSRPLTQLRMLLSDRDRQWYEAGSPSSVLWPFYWQNRLLRQSVEQGEPIYQYQVDVSADGENWTTVADHRVTHMFRSYPVLVDWDGNGKIDLIQAHSNRRWHSPWGVEFMELEYHLYRNRGTNAQPIYDTPEPIMVDGQPLRVGPSHQISQCPIAVVDLEGDGRWDLLIYESNHRLLRAYHNISTQPGGTTFRRGEPVGHPTPIRTPGARQMHVHVADVTGNGVADLLWTPSQSPYLFAGIAAGASSNVAGQAARAEAGASGPHVVLRNGPADGASRPAYDAMQAAWIHGGEPDKVQGQDLLQVRSRHNQRDDPQVVLLRFADLPVQGRKIRRATLELTAEAADGLVLPPSMFDISAYAIEQNWHPAHVTWQQPAQGQSWTADPMQAGTFLAHQNNFATIGPRQPVAWDVTQALLAAQARGEHEVNLLLRVNYGGLYSADRGYRFLGPAHGQISDRPRLVIEYEP